MCGCRLGTGGGEGTTHPIGTLNLLQLRLLLLGLQLWGCWNSASLLLCQGRRNLATRLEGLSCLAACSLPTHQKAQGLLLLLLRLACRVVPAVSCGISYVGCA